MIKHLLLLLFLLPASSVFGQNRLEVDLPEGAPLRMTAETTKSGLVVDLEIDSGWHLYLRETGGGEVVSFSFAANSDYEAAGPIECPPSEKGTLEKSGRIGIPLRLKKGAEGRTLAASFNFMACDPIQCLPPMSATIKGEIDRGKPKIKVLLAVAELEDRSTRIQTFLTENGFACRSITYDEISAEDCQASDVILADSKLFRQTKGVREIARKFPETDRPIVGVGFLATELFEVQGIAMTSGYI